MKVWCSDEAGVYVLFPRSRVSCDDTQVAPCAPRDEQVLNLAATLLRRGDDFARQCLSQTGAARAASLRGGPPPFRDPVMEMGTFLDS